MEHARILPDRQSLLERIPKGCVTCEVGVAFGTFSRNILNAVQPKKHYMIDSWVHAGRYDGTAFLAVLKEFKQELRTGQAGIFRTDSVTGIAELPDAGIDFLYIDTDHSYPTTKRELAAAHAKISPSGIIAGHDFIPGRFDEQRSIYIHYGVMEAVREFCKDYDYELSFLTLDENIPYSFAIKKVYYTQ